MSSTVTTAKKDIEVVIDSAYEVATETAKLDNPVLASAIAGFVQEVVPGVNIPSATIAGVVVAVGAAALVAKKLIATVKTDVQPVQPVLPTPPTANKPTA